MSPSFSIIVVAYGKRAVTETCLESLDAAFGDRLGADVELVLVDNASPDDTADLFAEWADRATVLALPENRNFAGGYNAGAAAARGDVLVLLNNDTIVPVGALDQLADQARDETVGLVGCRLVYPDGTLQHGGFGWRAVRDGGITPFHLFHHEAADLPAAAGIYDLDSVTGACVAIRRELFTDHGGFDEGFVNGWEDVDLCLRLRVAGLRVVYRGDVAVVHAEGQTSGGHYGSDNNVVRFEQRWLSALDDDSARVGELFDAEFPTVEDPVIGPPRHPSGSTLLFTGPVTGLSPDGAEARALIAAADGAGLAPAARDVAPVWLRPRLEADAARALDAALTRPFAPWAAKIRVGDDPRGLSGRPHVLRLAGPPAGPLDPETFILAADPATAASAVEAGADPARVRVLAPVVAPAPRGPGGEGLLVLLPAHDEARLRDVAAGLARVDAPITIVPSASDPRVAELADDVGAELAAPISDETRLGRFAGRFDAVVCADPRDRFGRAALVAAQAGAAPILLDDTPAGSVLGEHAIHTAADDPTALGAAVAAALAATDRDARAAVVSRACDPAAAGAQIDDVLREAQLGPYAERHARESVLVVAPAPPTHDRDSGSLRLFRLLGLLRDEGLHVTVAVHGIHGLERYVDDLERLGIEVYGGEPDITAIVADREYRLAVLTPYRVAEAHTAMIRQASPATRIIVDTVDLHHVREQRAAELSGDAAALEAAASTARRERAAYAAADGLIAVSEDERTALEAFVPGVPVGVVSNIHGAEPVGGGYDTRDGLLFVAGFGHPPNVDAAIWFCNDVLPLIRRQLPDVPVRMVGSNPPAEIRALARDGVEVTGWVPSTTPYITSARLSIAPLRYGAGVKGKVGEALAHGLPVVTTPVGAEGMDLRDGEDVLVADGAEAFAVAVVRAYTDAQLWQRLREGGRVRLLERLGTTPALAGWRAHTHRVLHGATFLAMPPLHDAEALPTVLRSYLGTFSSDDPVSLVLGIPEPSQATYADVASAIVGLGHDPARIPDIAICDVRNLAATQAWHVAFEPSNGRARSVRADDPLAFRTALAPV